MNNILALILAGGRVDELLCLTERRAKAAVPIFGIFRFIDFVLSNMMHAGIDNVGILSQYRPHGLIRHIDTGEHWDFVGRKRSIRILSPYSGLRGSDWYKGTADAVYQNIPYIEEFEPKHILIAAADHIYRMDYKAMIKQHIRNNADATIAFKCMKTKSSRFGYGLIKNNELTGYIEKPENPPSDYVSMTLYIFQTDFLLRLLQANASVLSHEFGRDIIPAIVKKYNIQAFIFHDYWAYARTIDAYFQTNMDLIKGRINLNRWQIRTNLLERCRFRDRVPAYVSGQVENSIISDECVVCGKVRNSILSPGVEVATGAEVNDSIIFHDTKIGPRAKLNKVICDKDTRISADCTIGGFGKKTMSQQFKKLLSSGITILGRKTIIPRSARIGANTVVYPGARISDLQIEPGSTVK